MKTSEEGRQTMLFSATFPPSMRRLAADFTHRYVWLSIGRVGSATKNITQSLSNITPLKNITSMSNITES